ncbi:MAG: S8 family serine peptidase [Pseudomonadota bacterium]
MVFESNHLYDPGGGQCGEADCWGAELAGMAALAPDACGRGAPVALVDTAVDPSHPALRGASVEARSFLPPRTTEAETGHGAALAALLVGEVAQGLRPLAPGARLLAASVFRSHRGGARADAVAVLRGIDWAVQRRARVVALSLQGPPNEALRFAVRRAAQRVNLVAAAGNGGPGGAPAYPAAWPEVMAVAAVDGRLRPYRNGTRGDYVEIAAPGVGVVAPAADGAPRTWSGSSFAVPFAAAAMLRARAETRGDAAAARRLLQRTARDLGAPGRDEVYGFGLLQAPWRRCW